MQLYSFPPRAQGAITIPQDVPVYRIKEGKFYADDELFEAGTIISWPDEPNEEMEPLNDLARERMIAFLEMLDKHARAAAEKAGKAYVSRVDAFANSYALAKEEGRRVSVLNGPAEKSILGAKRGRPRGKKIELAKESSQEVREVGSREAVNETAGVGKW